MISLPTLMDTFSWTQRVSSRSCGLAEQRSWLGTFVSCFSHDSPHTGHGNALSASFAPYQRVPRVKPRRDVREGTIERDPAYRRFLEELEKGVEVTAWWQCALMRVCMCVCVCVCVCVWNGDAFFGALGLRLGDGFVVLVAVGGTPLLLQKLPSAEQQMDAEGPADEFELEKKVVETALVAFVMKKRRQAALTREKVRIRAAFPSLWSVCVH